MLSIQGVILIIVEIVVFSLVFLVARDWKGGYRCEG